jgi:hypothetical protein
MAFTGRDRNRGHAKVHCAATGLRLGDVESSSLAAAASRVSCAHSVDDRFPLRLKDVRVGRG